MEDNKNTYDLLVSINGKLDDVNKKLTALEGQVQKQSKVVNNYVINKKN